MTVKRWSTYEENFVRENYGKVTIKEIAKQLGRTYQAVRWQIFYKLKLPSKFVETFLLNEYERGWLEAIIDGEGCLTIAKNKDRNYPERFTYAPVLVITNTCLNLLKRVKEVCRGGMITNARLVPRHKPTYEFRLVAHKLRIILPQLRLIAKERQRNCLLQVLDLRYNLIHGESEHFRRTRIRHGGKIYTKEDWDKFEEWYQQIKVLNLRGPTNSPTRHEPFI
jgi:hypothetical protein